MNSTKRNITIFTVALTALALTSIGTVSAEEAKETVIRDATEVKTSTIPNKLFLNRRGFYDRVNDVWVYRAR